MGAVIERLKTFIKKRDTVITFVIIFIVTVGLITKGYIYSTKINSNGKLCYGVVFKEGSKHYTYNFFANGQRFEGNIGGKKHNIGDTLIIQYYINNPVIHIIHSKKKQGSIESLQRKRIGIWDTF